MLKMDIYSFTRDRIPKELTGDHDNTPGYKQGHTPLVEQLEGEVVNGDLGNGEKLAVMSLLS